MLFHTHGIGGIDFSSMSPDNLQEIDDLSASRSVQLVPTIFLRRQYTERFRQILNKYAAGRAEGLYEHILGFGVEGPLLGASGGVPQAGCWEPSAAEWMELAALGGQGLSYIVMAPDAMELTEALGSGLIFRDVIDAFYLNGVKLALGHFRHSSPELSARRTERIIDYIQARYGPSPLIVITDHLFNDMPRQFTHAWRTPEQRVRRDSELKEFLDKDWKLRSVSELLGPVPGVLLRAAAEDRLTPTLNFDGEHVDLEICRRTVDFLGSERLIAITDDTEVTEMAGEPLSRRSGSSLLFRPDGKVAAGSSGATVQARNIRSIGAGGADLANLLGKVARSVLNADVRAGGDRGAAPLSGKGFRPSRQAEHAGLVEDYLAELKDCTANIDPSSLGQLIGGVVETIRGGQTVFIAGNGGNATTAAHMASDWSRAAARSGIKPARIWSITDNTASVTGLANDLDFSRALAQRLLESGQAGDLLLILSVSGDSPNLIDAARAAREDGLGVTSLVGQPGQVTRLSDHWVAIGTGDYGLAEDLQVAVNHMVVRALSGGELPGTCTTSRKGKTATTTEISEALA